MSAWIIYWIGVAGGARQLFLGTSLFSGFAVIALFVCWILAKSDGVEIPACLTKKIMPLSVLLFFMSLVAGTFMPSSKTLAAMYFLPPLYNAVVENEEVKKLPDNVVELANEWIEELKPNNSNRKEETK